MPCSVWLQAADIDVKDNDITFPFSSGFGTLVFERCGGDSSNIRSHSSTMLSFVGRIGNSSVDESNGIGMMYKYLALKPRARSHANGAAAGNISCGKTEGVVQFVVTMEVENGEVEELGAPRGDHAATLFGPASLVTPPARIYFRQ